jgi:hypothetical protein
MKNGEKFELHATSASVLQRDMAAIVRRATMRSVLNCALILSEPRPEEQSRFTLPRFCESFLCAYLVRSDRYFYAISSRKS